MLSVKQTIILSGLTIVLVLAPESLLITRTQFFRAKTPYQKLETGDIKGIIRTEIPLLDFKNRIRACIDSLPPVLKTKINF